MQCTALLLQPLLPSLAFSLFQLLLFGTKINTPLSGAPNFYSIAFHTPTNVRSGAASGAAVRYSTVPYSFEDMTTAAFTFLVLLDC